MFRYILKYILTIHIGDIRENIQCCNLWTRTKGRRTNNFSRYFSLFFFSKEMNLSSTFISTFSFILPVFFFFFFSSSIIFFLLLYLLHLQFVVDWQASLLSNVFICYFYHVFSLSNWNTNGIFRNLIYLYRMYQVVILPI